MFRFFKKCVYFDDELGKKGMPLNTFFWRFKKLKTKNCILIGSNFQILLLILECRYLTLIAAYLFQAQVKSILCIKKLQHDTFTAERFESQKYMLSKSCAIKTEYTLIQH